MQTIARNNISQMANFLNEQINSASFSRARQSGGFPAGTLRLYLLQPKTFIKGAPMSETRHTKVLIIGSGPAGYTAGVYASRAMLEPILVQGIEPGGQLTTTTEVENYPGFTEVQGPDLMIKMQAHAAAMGTEIIADIITDLDLSKRPFIAKGDSGTTYSADAIILATGARAKWLGLPSEEEFKGFGVSACATCDGFFYRGMEIVVVGGGNTAV